jgi:hypothetical protein
VALDGQIKRGELIDLVATYGTGTDAYATVVTSGARVLDVDDGHDLADVGGTGAVTITIAVSSDEQVLAADHALAVAKVSVVRTTRAGDAPDVATGDDAPGTGPTGAPARTYRPTAPTTGGAGGVAPAGVGGAAP